MVHSMFLINYNQQSKNLLYCHNPIDKIMISAITILVLKFKKIKQYQKELQHLTKKIKGRNHGRSGLLFI